MAHRTKKPAIAQQTSAKSSWYEIAGQKAQGSNGLREIIERDPGVKMLIMSAMLSGN